mmetsp:Transcript_973/g.1127  ORF Transcript_973/g.1127 Transcript_973/m.1127 type:complete len:85 (+) Transcript_973:667-921(+)
MTKKKRRILQVITLRMEQYLKAATTDLWMMTIPIGFKRSTVISDRIKIDQPLSFVTESWNTNSILIDRFYANSYSIYSKHHYQY